MENKLEDINHHLKMLNNSSDLLIEIARAFKLTGNGEMCNTLSSIALNIAKHSAGLRFNHNYYG